MSDLITMMWKEITEFFNNRRSLRVFIIAVLAMGILPAISFAHHQTNYTFDFIRVIYVLFAATIVVAQTAPDLVLHERNGHTLDYLLTTRLPDYSIFGAKVLISSALGYIAAIIALAVQIIATALIGKTGWNLLGLNMPVERLVVFGLTACLCLYVSVIGTFVALRVGEQRAAYMVTIFSVGLLIGPFLVGWLHISTTLQWIAHVTISFAIIAIGLGLLGLRLFRRDMLVLFLQD